MLQVKLQRPSSLSLPSLALVFGLGLALPAFAAKLPAEGRTAPAHGYFISIDGLTPALLRPLHNQGLLTAPRGLDWLLDGGLIVDKAWPVVTSITAPSHISTITCTPPSRHGVIANSFLADGKMVSGFNQPFATEPLWKAAARQGRKVLALAYVGADGRTPERRADFSLTYPDQALMPPSHTLVWKTSTLPAASGWTLPQELQGNKSLKETTLTIKLDPRTTESRLVHVLVDLTQPTAPRYVFDADKNLTNGNLGGLSGSRPYRTLDFYFVERDPNAAMHGVKRRVFVRPLAAPAAGELALYVSKASYNNAYPESFRRRLDALNLVWPDYGVRAPLSPPEFVETQAMIDRFLAKVGARMAPALKVGLVLFYQPLLDTVGHKYQARLPMPFNPRAQDDITRAFVHAFRIIDADVGQLLRAATTHDVVALMGDHGMSPLHEAVNLAPLLPKDRLGHIDITMSSALTLLYAHRTPGQVAVTPAALAEARQDGDALVTRLKALRYKGQPVLDQVRDEADALVPPAADYRKEWAYGQAFRVLLPADGLIFVDVPSKPQIFLDPPIQGTHGYGLDVQEMATTLVIRAPKLAPRHVAAASLLDAVPTFAALLGLAPPRDCLGHSLVKTTSSP